jgi:hypothetical protein
MTCQRGPASVSAALRESGAALALCPRRGVRAAPNASFHVKPTARKVPQAFLILGHWPRSNGPHACPEPVEGPR